MIYGMGFTLTPEERDELVARDKKNDQRMFPYLGGEEVNTSPTQSFHRYVINFGDMSLEAAGRWPDLLHIVKEKVKPERDRLRDNSIGRRRKQYWWRYGSESPAVYAAIRDLPRCLVVARTSKHLALAFQPTDRVFSENLIVFPLQHFTVFSILQCRVHVSWVALTSSTLESRQGYRPTDCFDTFPFPQESPRTTIPGLESVGRELYDARAQYLINNNIGLTCYYNALKCGTQGVEIDYHRQLHTELDQAVLRTYGWEDLAIDVPPFGPPMPDDFKEEILDRLFKLNKERSEKERNAHEMELTHKRNARAQVHAEQFPDLDQSVQ